MREKKVLQPQNWQSGGHTWTNRIRLPSFVASPFEHICAVSGTGKEVETTCSKCQVLSLFPSGEPIDGDTIVPYTLHSFPSTATPFVGTQPQNGAISNPILVSIA